MDIKQEVLKSIKKIMGENNKKELPKKSLPIKKSGSVFKRTFEEMSAKYDHTRQKYLREYMEKVSASDKEFQDYISERKKSGKDISVKSFIDYKDKLKEVRKQSLMYKLFRLTPTTFITVRPVILPERQLKAELWWRNINNKEAFELLKNTDLIIYRLSREIIIADRESPESLYFIILNYWTLITSVAIMGLLSLTLLFYKSVILFILMFLVMMRVLWLCKWAECKNMIGLKFFCPLTTSAIVRLYEKENACDNKVQEEE